MRILMLVATSVVTDTRVMREAGSLVDAGHSVHVIGKDVPPEFIPPAGITVSSVGAASVFRPSGEPATPARRMSAPRRLARWALLPQHRNQVFGSWAAAAIVEARHREFDVVHAHDFTALEAGAALAVERGVPYVYDSHEFWLGQQRQYRPTPWQDRRERRVEGRLGGSAAAVITVGEGVADALRAAYGWSHVVVVRNSFPVRAAGGPALPEAPSGLVFAGRVDAHRELETVLEAAADLPDFPVTMVGPVDEVWVGQNAHRIEATGTTLMSAVSIAEVTDLLRRTGLSLVTLSATSENHMLAMPNKLFHAVHAGVPVIATENPAIAAIVRQFGIGEVYRAGDAAGLAAAVRRAVERYPELVASVAAAAEELSWNADAQRLRSVYERI